MRSSLRYFCLGVIISYYLGIHWWIMYLTLTLFSSLLGRYHFTSLAIYSSVPILDMIFLFVNPYLCVCPINWPFHSSCYLVDQWKFAFLSLGRPEYLADTDTVFNRFQVCFLSIIFFFFSLGLVPSRMWVHYICFYFNIFCKLKLCFVSFFQLFFPFSLETRRLWCLGTVPWVGAFW